MIQEAHIHSHNNTRNNDPAYTVLTIYGLGTAEAGFEPKGPGRHLPAALYLPDMGEANISPVTSSSRGEGHTVRIPVPLYIPFH